MKLSLIFKKLLETIEDFEDTNQFNRSKFEFGHCSSILSDECVLFCVCLIDILQSLFFSNKI